jgi:SAM-dependent methyltransferase
MSSSPPPVEGRWTSPEAGTRYSKTRWRSHRAANRDPRLVQKLLARHAQGLSIERVLDVPCGTGRLNEALSQLGMVTSVDVSLSMLQAHTSRLGRGVQASAWELPLASDSFDLVVSCRLMHHVGDSQRRAALIAELARVSGGLVLASFWDKASWHAWRRSAGMRRARHPDGRVSVAKDQLATDFEAAGAQVLGFAHSLKFVSPQTWIAARVAPR